MRLTTCFRGRMLLVKLAPVGVCFLLCFLLARVAAGRGQILSDWRLSWVFAAMGTGVFVVAIAEAASALNRLNRVGMAVAWVGVDVALLLVIFWRFRAEAAASLRGIGGIKEAWLKLNGTARSLYAAGAALAVVLGLLALEAPTFVWDCKSYHVPRLLNWIQDQNLRPFPATDIRRVAYNPGAEIAATTLELLDGSDRPINLVSWFCVISAALLAAFLTELFMEWSGGRRGKPWQKGDVELAGALCFVLVLTIPEGLTQAISTENDFVAAFWNLSLALMILLVARRPENPYYMAGAGLALGLGICTKATTFISAAPFVAGGLGLLAWRRQTAAALGLGFAMVAAGAALNAPWFLRNFNVFGHFLGPRSVAAANVNASFAPAYCAANLLRDLSIYTSTPWAAVTGAANHFLEALIRLTGRPLDDPASIVTYTDPWHTTHFWAPGASSILAGDGVGNVQAWLLLATLLMLPALPWRSGLGFYIACVGVGFCLSCGYLRWHPWIFRLHITYFVLALPVASVALAGVAHRWLGIFAGYFCVGNALLLLGFNTQYPVYAPFLNWTREENQFESNLYLHEPYVGLAEDIIQRGCTNVLLKCELYHFDYGLWVCLRDRGYRGTIQEFLVDNETGETRPWNLTARTAMVFIGVRPPEDRAFEIDGKTQPLLEIGYYGYRATVTALFPSLFSDYWWRLVGQDNHADLTMNLSAASDIGPMKPAAIHFSCTPVDGAGRPITNNVLRLIRGGRATDFPLGANGVDVTARVTQPYLEIRAALLQPLPSERRPAYLSKLRLSWDWAR